MLRNVLQGLSGIPGGHNFCIYANSMHGSRGIKEDSPPAQANGSIHSGGIGADRESILLRHAGRPKQPLQAASSAGRSRTSVTPESTLFFVELGELFLEGAEFGQIVEDN